jgi:hypothetical protein
MMRNSLLVLASILIPFAGGCTVYYKQPGKTTADFDRDKRYCERIAREKYKDNYTRMCDETDRCLVNEKGWKRE